MLLPDTAAPSPAATARPGTPQKRSPLSHSGEEHFGAVVDPTMKDEIRVTVIATGFERPGLTRQLFDHPRKAAWQTSEVEVSPAAPMPARTENRPTPQPIQPEAPTEEFKGRTFSLSLGQMMLDPAAKGAAAEATRPDPSGGAP